jgi:hypothetical protein
VVGARVGGAVVGAVVGGEVAPRSRMEEGKVSVKYVRKQIVIGQTVAVDNNLSCLLRFKTNMMLTYLLLSGEE